MTRRRVTGGDRPRRAGNGRSLTGHAGGAKMGSGSPIRGARHRCRGYPLFRHRLAHPLRVIGFCLTRRFVDAVS